MNGSKLLRTTRRVAPLVAATTLVLAPALSAQEPPEPLGTPTDEHHDCVCSWEGEAPRALRSLMGSFMAMNRGRIGVRLGESAAVAGRTGIRLTEVVDDGPAARAGIQAGDVLLGVNGTDLGEDPAERLLELLADIEPGDTVTLAYSRDGDQRTATVVTDHSPGVFSYRAGEAPRVMRLNRMAPRVRGMAAPDVRTRMRHRMGGGLQLVAMNEGLGAYFDVSEGVLVAEVDEGSNLGLRAGDVIVAIGGREVLDPAHARSIIASYRADESIEFGVVRDGRRLTVDGTRGGR